MKVLICNPDEEEAKRIEKEIKAFHEKTHIDLESYTVFDPVDAISAKDIFDIAVIEVEMEGINGIYLGRVLKKANPYIKLLFTSAVADGLDASLDILAVRFYKRPYSSERFYSGIMEAIKRLNNETIVFDLKDKNLSIRINKNEIIYIEIDQRKTKVVTSKNIYFSNHSMSFWKQHLRSFKFVVPHNSYLINLDYIEMYKRNCYIIMSNNTNISIARGKGADFHKKYNAYRDSII